VEKFFTRVGERKFHVIFNDFTPELPLYPQHIFGTEFVKNMFQGYCKPDVEITSRVKSQENQSSPGSKLGLTSLLGSQIKLALRSY
jgi:hypothetical protein